MRTKLIARHQEELTQLWRAAKETFLWIKTRIKYIYWEIKVFLNCKD